MNTNLNLDKGNVLNYLLESERNNPLKVAYFSETMEYKYSKLLKDTMAIATGLIKKLGVSLRPILIYMEKSPFMLSAFWGSVMSRNFYVPLDISMPELRINLIVENLKPAAIITDVAHFDDAKAFCTHVFAQAHVRHFADIAREEEESVSVTELNRKTELTKRLNILKTIKKSEMY